MKQYIELILVAAIMVGTFAACWATYSLTTKYHQASHQRFVTEMTLSSERVLAAHNLAISAIRAELETTKKELEDEYSEQIKDRDVRIAELVRTVNRLRDPGANQSGDTGSNPNPGSPDSSDGSCSAEGLLSEQATEFLLRFAIDADAVAARLHACQVWVETITERVNSHN